VKTLETEKPALYAEVKMDKTLASIPYVAVDTDKVKTLSSGDQATIEGYGNQAKKEALQTVAIFPAIMLVSYLGLLAYFHSKGGYRPQSLVDHAVVSAEPVKQTPAS
jgi:hypothetical protein